MFPTVSSSLAAPAGSFQSLADCSACRVQGAVIEMHDGAEEGGPLSSRCRMCGREETQGRETTPARRLATVADVEEALVCFAHEEGFASARELVESAFVLGDVALVHAALILGEPVETSFDVMGFLFSHLGGAVPGRDDLGAAIAPAAALADERGPVARLSALERRAPSPRNALLALASAALADGELVDAERELLDAATRDRGVAPLAPDELRVHRPDEVGPVGALLDRERMLEHMVAMAFCDVPAGGDVDASEVRVLRVFARAWGVDPARVEGWLREREAAGLGPFARVKRTLARHLFPES